MSEDLVSTHDVCFSDRFVDQLSSLARRGTGACKDMVNVTIPRWRRNRDQESLEAALAKIIETANGHQSKGVPRGSPVYFALRDKANERINAFCTKWTVDRFIIEAEAPSLNDLRVLCIPDKETPTAIKALACLLGGILSMVLIGAASGIIHAGHNGVLHLLSR
jgi:hypothetical protein